MRARPPREITTAEAVSSSFQDVTTMPNVPPQLLASVDEVIE